MKYPIFLSLFACVLFAYSCSSIQFAFCAEGDKTKDLYFEQLKTPEKPKNAGIRYSIQLYRNGQQVSTVDDTYEFKRGDKIRIRVTSNINGFAHVALQKGSTGAAHPLFPPPGQNAKIVAGKELLMPSVGFLEFDKNPGQEVLLVAISPQSADTLTSVQTEMAGSDSSENASEDSSDIDEEETNIRGKSKDIFYTAPTQKKKRTVRRPLITRAVALNTVGKGPALKNSATHRATAVANRADSPGIILLAEDSAKFFTVLTLNHN